MEVIMDQNEIYVNIIEHYAECGSVTKVAKELKVSEERVRRTLITEGLWTSKSAAPIIELFNQGKTVPEIAKKLTISEKTVQSYMPYLRGMYGGEKSDAANRSVGYRERMKTAAQKMQREIPYIPLEELPETLVNKDITNKNLRLIESEQGKKPWEKTTDRLGKNREYVYRLRFDLVGTFIYGADENLDLNDNEKERFLKLAKARNGISRTVLVPGSMNLHAMHYMILRLFGWQNEHLHRFSFSENDFNRLTQDTVGGWLELCGALLHFPSHDNADSMWDDDYEPTKSVKNWLKGKYKGKYRNLSVSDTMWGAQKEVKRFENDFLLSEKNIAGKVPISRSSTLKQLDQVVTFEQPFNCISERLTLNELFAGRDEVDKSEDAFKTWMKMLEESRDKSLSDIKNLNQNRRLKKELDECVEELSRWRSLQLNVESAVMYGREKEVREHFGKSAESVIREAKEAIPVWEKDTFSILNAWNPVMIPYFDSIYYEYDFGDGWCIKITCEKRYQRKDDWDFADNTGYMYMGIMNHKDGLDKYRYFDENETEVDDEFRNVLANVDVKQAPLCIEADGLSLVEDAGGIHGFLNMLEILNGDDLDEKAEMREWAKGLGWTGKMTKPENML